MSDQSVIDEVFNHIEWRDKQITELKESIKWRDIQITELKEIIFLLFNVIDKRQ